MFPPLKRGENIITSPDEIYANISRDPHKKNKSVKNRKRKKDEELPYNEPFTDREPKAAIKQKQL